MNSFLVSFPQNPLIPPPPTPKEGVLPRGEPEYFDIFVIA